MPANNETPPQLTTAELLSRLVSFVNTESREIADEKAALNCILEAGLVRERGGMVEVDGVPISLDRRIGQLEGREEGLNSLASFAITTAADNAGKLDPNKLN